MFPISFSKPLCLFPYIIFIRVCYSSLALVSYSSLLLSFISFLIPPFHHIKKMFSGKKINLSQLRLTLVDETSPHSHFGKSDSVLAQSALVAGSSVIEGVEMSYH